MDTQSLLQKLGLSPAAARIYLVLLELGKTTADKIAKRAETYKANVYDALQRLSELGLATVMMEGNKRWFLPTSPEKLPRILDELKAKRDAEIEEMRTSLKTAIPQLSAKYASVESTEAFEVYRGRKAYKLLMNEIVASKPKEWKGFGNLQVQAYFPTEFKRWFSKAGIKLFSTDTPEVHQRLKDAKQTANVEIHWLPSELFMPIVWTVFGKNLLIIIYEPDIILFRIKAPDVVRSFEQQFEYLWKRHSS